MKAIKASTKIMKKTLTAHQQKMQRECDRMLSVISHATKGQMHIQKTVDLLNRTDSTILTPEYKAQKQSAYDRYQEAINNAEARMKELKQEARDQLLFSTIARGY
jgi:hypothetical protein